MIDKRETETERERARAETSRKRKKRCQEIKWKRVKEMGRERDTETPCSSGGMKV